MKNGFLQPGASGEAGGGQQGGSRWFPPSMPSGPADPKELLRLQLAVAAAAAGADEDDEEGPLVGRLPACLPDRRTDGPTDRLTD